MNILSANTDTADKDFEASELKKEWDKIERLVEEYKTQFEECATEEDKRKARDAADELVRCFYPLFKKYSNLLKSGQIDFDDPEKKHFVLSFIDDPSLKRALRRDKQSSEFRAQIYRKFNFVKETYGSLAEEEIMTDMQMLFLGMAKRYKQMGKSFCAYLYNGFKFEVSRHIKKFIRNPLNIPYKHIEYEDYMKSYEEQVIECDFEDRYYEESTGIPDITWIQGVSCTETFSSLTPIERKLLIKYYLEDWNDRQISEEFGIHINTVNQKRRAAIAKIAGTLEIDTKDIKRNRKSGKKAIMPNGV